MAGIVRLSRESHEALGDQVAGELEAGFDHVEAVSRAAHRELLDLIVDRRIGVAKADLRVDIKDLEVRLRQEMGGLEVRLRQEIGGLEVRLFAELAKLDTRIATAESRILKWVFLFWISTIAITFLKP